MTRMCAWCSRVIGVKAPFDNSAVTHGMCVECWDRVSAQLPLGGRLGRRPSPLAVKLPSGRARRPGRPGRVAQTASRGAR